MNLLLQISAFFPQSFLDRPYLDTAEPRRGPAGCDLERLVQIPRVDQNESAEGLFRFRKWTVRDGDISSSDPNGGGTADAL